MFERLHNKVYLLLLVLLATLSQESSAQIGGLNTYHFLSLAPSARATAVGGLMPSVADDDISQGHANPALLNSSMQGKLALNHRFHVAGISHGTMSYGFKLDTAHTLLVGFQYVGYGEFIRADEFGNRDGTFDASEVALVIGTSHRVDDRLRVGINLKYVSSSLDIYGSGGIGGDIGLHYYNPDKNSNWSILLKNIGGQISTAGLSKEAFPLDFQIGYAKRLEHLPFRFMVTARNIQRWKLTYDSELNGDVTIINGAQNESSPLGDVVDNVFRHLTFGGELLIGPNEGFRIRMGYSHQRNKELTVAGYRSLSGFSLGFGIKMKKLRLDYGFGRYHLAGSTNHIGLTVDLAELFSKI